MTSGVCGSYLSLCGVNLSLNWKRGVERAQSVIATRLRAGQFDSRQKDQIFIWSTATCSIDTGDKARAVKVTSHLCLVPTSIV
jgi:hypothetical protein